jgi:hypothetical protein
MEAPMHRYGCGEKKKELRGKLRAREERVKETKMKGTVELMFGAQRALQTVPIMDVGLSWPRIRCNHAFDPSTLCASPSRPCDVLI